MIVGHRRAEPAPEPTAARRAFDPGADHLEPRCVALQNATGEQPVALGLAQDQERAGEQEREADLGSTQPMPKERVHDERDKCESGGPTLDA